MTGQWPIPNVMEYDKRGNLAGLCGPASVVPTVVFANGKRIARGHVRHLCPGDDLVVPDSKDGNAAVDLFDQIASVTAAQRRDHRAISGCYFVPIENLQKLLVNVTSLSLTMIPGTPRRRIIFRNMSFAASCESPAFLHGI